MRSCVHGSHAAAVLKDGDLVLAVNEQPVSSYRHVESLIAAQHLAVSTSSDAPCSLSSSTQDKSNVLAGCSFDAKENNIHVPSLAVDLNCSAGKAAVLSSHRSDAAMQDKTAAAEINSLANTTTELIKASRLQTSAPEENDTVAASGSIARPSVAVTVFRGAAVEVVRVQLGLEDGLGTRRLVHWCGALLQVTCTTLHMPHCFFGASTCIAPAQHRSTLLMRAHG